MNAIEFGLGDTVQMKKKHPCGTDLWVVIRTGADIKIRCTGCDRVVMMNRPLFEKRARRVVRRAGEESPAPSKGD
ncbi:MAG: DUF951 domain-containing protein [Clostridiales bacterium]|nr:DUF951 domain-containing protein [Clostridiales bacterium]